MRVTLGRIAEVTGGVVVGGDPRLPVTSASIDSRTLVPGGLFVAVVGERDGHDFVDDAARAGAAAALVSRTGPDLPLAVVVVDDTVAALGRLGSHARDRLAPGVAVIGITGSTGKTSTKDLTAAALSAGSVVASEASFNNELGVPLTLLAAEPDTDALVVEMGARGIGDIKILAEIARPQVGIVTMIGTAHTERFGSEAEIVEAKGELLEALPSDGHGVVGVDHPWAEPLLARSSAPTVTVGRDPAADVRVSAVEVDGHLRPRFLLETPWGSARPRLEVRGMHQAINGGLAVAAAVVAGAGFDAAVAGIERARSSAWRLEVDVTRAGVIVLNDAYNANPDSMSAALDALADVDVSGTRWAVLGEMAELGDRTGAEHASIGRLAGERAIDVVVAVGVATTPLASAARDAGCDVREVDAVDGAIDVVLREVAAGDAVLVKASRVVGLERVAEALHSTAEGASA